ncbi:MAG: hypothetical protein ACYC99_03675 [Candidatus Geothermincolia bacterium]
MFRPIRTERRLGFLAAVTLSGLLLLTAMLVAAGCGSSTNPSSPNDPSGSMKGYELYSWSANGQWSFAVLPGTNRIKTFAEISGSGVQGVERIEMLLRGVPKGSPVIWTTRDIKGLAMPPKETIAAIKSYCAGKGINLSVD